METFNLEHYLQAPHKCVIINRGLPASGKSAWTAEMLANTPGFTSVSKDDLRKGLGNWTPKKERTVVLPTRDKIITTNLELGFSVIVDDTNFESKHLTRIEEIANEIVPTGSFEEEEAFLEKLLSNIAKQHDIVQAVAHTKQQNNTFTITSSYAFLE